jgi:hypothetical protein
MKKYCGVENCSLEILMDWHAFSPLNTKSVFQEPFYCSTLSAGHISIVPAIRIGYFEFRN